MSLVSPTKLSTPLPPTGRDAPMLLLIRWVVLVSCNIPGSLTLARYLALTLIILDTKVINKFKATNAGHKDMLAVLAAVTEVRDKMNPKYFVPTPIAR